MVTSSIFQQAFQGESKTPSECSATTSSGHRGDVKRTTAREAFVVVEDLSQRATSSVASCFTNRVTRRRTGAAEMEAVYTGGAENPFDEAQCNCLGDVVGESISASLTTFGNSFGKRIQDRFDMVEARVDMLVEGNAVVTTSRVDELEKQFRNF